MLRIPIGKIGDTITLLGTFFLRPFRFQKCLPVNSDTITRLIVSIKQYIFDYNRTGVIITNIKKQKDVSGTVGNRVFSYNSKGIGAVAKYVYAGGNKSWE